MKITYQHDGKTEPEDLRPGDCFIAEGGDFDGEVFLITDEGHAMHLATGTLCNRPRGRRRVVEVEVVVS